MLPILTSFMTGSAPKAAHRSLFSHSPLAPSSPPLTLVIMELLANCCVMVHYSLQLESSLMYKSNPVLVPPCPHFSRAPQCY